MIDLFKGRVKNGPTFFIREYHMEIGFQKKCNTVAA